MGPALYHIIGDGETLLHECFTETEARRWIAEYTRYGDWGGYAFLALDHYGLEMNDRIEVFDNPAFD